MVYYYVVYGRYLNVITLNEMNITNLPSPLYKYMESKYADRLMRKGILRISPLYDYRQVENYGTIRGDKDEGVISTYSNDTMELWRPETVPEFLRKHIKGEGKYIKLQGIEFRETTTSQNYYIYCVSEEYNHNLMSEFKYDSCIQIDDSEMFFRLITGKLYEEGEIEKDEVRLARCQYENRKQHYTEKRSGRHPALIKDTYYSHQKEIRAIWKPRKTNIKPLQVECPEVIRYCHKINPMTKNSTLK